jgi:hypothetical protein
MVSEEYSLVCVELLVPHREKGLQELLVPQSTRLLESVEGFSEKANARVGVGTARGLVHKDVILEGAV